MKTYTPLLGSLAGVIGGTGISLTTTREWLQITSLVIGVLTGLSFLVIQWRREFRHTRNHDEQVKQNRELKRMNIRLLKQLGRSPTDERRDIDEE